VISPGLTPSLLPHVTSHTPLCLSVSLAYHRPQTPSQKAYQTLYEHMGLGDHVAVTNIIVTKASCQGVSVQPVCVCMCVFT
jgi:preprotein translocase subunit YajC